MARIGILTCSNATQDLGKIILLLIIRRCVILIIEFQKFLDRSRPQRLLALWLFYLCPSESSIHT